jgi:hypothetical protein
MKNLLLLLVAVAVCGCGSVMKKSADPETAAAVAARVESGNYRIYFGDMDSRLNWPIMEDNKWNIELKDGILYSYLPYFGQAYVPVTGPQKGLDFDAPVQEYSVKAGRKGSLTVDFWVDSDDDRYNYRLTVYPSGSAYLRVNPDIKSSVGFSGKLEM